MIAGCNDNQKDKPRVQENISFINKAILDSNAKSDKEYILILGNFDDSRIRDLIDLSKELPSKHSISYFDTSVYTVSLEERDAKKRSANLKEYQAFLQGLNIKSLPTVIHIKKGKTVRQLEKLSPEDSDSKKQKNSIKEKYQEWLKNEE